MQIDIKKAIARGIDPKIAMWLMNEYMRQLVDELNAMGIKARLS